MTGNRFVGGDSDSQLPSDKEGYRDSDNERLRKTSRPGGRSYRKRDVGLCYKRAACVGPTLYADSRRFSIAIRFP